MVMAEMQDRTIDRRFIVTDSDTNDDDGDGDDVDDMYVSDLVTFDTTRDFLTHNSMWRRVVAEI